MERKKLYKAKKNWVIGLAVCAMFTFGGASVVNADTNNTGDTPVTVHATDDSSIYIGMSPQVAKNQVGQYNDQAVGYINPDDEVKTLGRVETYNNKQKFSYYMAKPNKETKRVFEGKGTVLIDTYGKPEVYAYTGNDKALNPIHQPYKHVEPKETSSIDGVDKGTYHYLNNGVSNAIQFNDPSLSSNYEAIDELSQAVSYYDYKDLSSTLGRDFKNKALNAFYDNGKIIIDMPSGELSSDDLSKLYDAAFRTRPIITFDKEVNGNRITSLLQSSVNSIDVGWHKNFDDGWHGWTFENGKQLSFKDILRPQTSDFNWADNVTRYIYQALKFKKKHDMFGSLTMEKKTGLPVSNAMEAFKKESLFNGNTQFIFMEKGVYVIISSVQQGYAPVLVQLPMAFLKPEYQAFYGANEKLHPESKDENAKPKKSEDNTVDLKKDNDKQIGDYVLDHWGDDAAQGTMNLGKDSATLFDFLDSLRDTIEDVSAAAHKGVRFFMSRIGDIANDFVSSAAGALQTIKAAFPNIKKEFKVAEGMSLFSSTYSLVKDMHNQINADNEKANVKEDAKHRKANFFNVRHKHIKTTEDSVSLLQQGLDLVKNPFAAIASSVIAILGIGFISVNLYSLTGEDKKLLKKFRLKKK